MQLSQVGSVAVLTILLFQSQPGSSELQFADSNCELIFGSLLEARNQIRSGECVISARATAPSKHGELVRLFNYRLAFDYDLGKSRWEYSQDLPVMGETGEIQRDTLEGTNLWLPEMSVTSKHSEIQLFDPRDDPHGWDLRLLGYMPWSFLEDEFRFDQFIEELRSSRIPIFVELLPTDGSLVEISMVWKHSELTQCRRQILLDVPLGLAPVKLSNSDRSRSSISAEWDEWETESVTDVGWRLHQKVVIPVSLSEVSYRKGVKPLTSQIRQAVDVRFEWQSVNESIDAELFNFKNLDIPVGTLRISDFRGGGDIVLQDPNIPATLLALRQNANAMSSQMIKPEREYATSKIVFWVSNVLAIAGFLTFLFFRKQKQGNGANDGVTRS